MVFKLNVSNYDLQQLLLKIMNLNNMESKYLSYLILKKRQKDLCPSCGFEQGTYHFERKGDTTAPQDTQLYLIEN